MGAAGQATFPLESVACLGSGVLVGLACKQRASRALRDGDCDAYLRWHAAWHYTLPVGAVLGQLVLHHPCDYSFWPSCNCGIP